MLGSYRGIIIALAGLGALFWAFMSGVSFGVSFSDSEEQRYQRYRYAADKPVELEPSALGQPNAEALEYRYPCDEPKGQGESDLCAQWKAANAAEDNAFWAKWGFWITGVGAIGLLITIIQSRIALSRASEANEIAREGDRAWVRMEAGPAARLSIKPNSLQFKCDVILSNYGASPALDVWSDGIIHFSRPRREDLLPRLAALEAPETAGHTILFAGTPEGGGIEVDWSGDKPAAAKIYVTLFAKYKVVGSDAWRLSAFTYVTKPDAATTMYGMVGDKIKLDYGTAEQIIGLMLHKGRGGLPIAT